MTLTPDRHEEPDQCQTRGKALFVKHILIYCRNYTDIEAKLNISGHLHKVLRPNQDCINKIIQFLNI